MSSLSRHQGLARLLAGSAAAMLLVGACGSSSPASQAPGASAAAPAGGAEDPKATDSGGKIMVWVDAPRVPAAEAFQKAHPDTLIIVTADHSHSSQIVSATTKPATGSAYATVQTADGAPMRLVYGTADTGVGATTSGSQSHTGAEVPLWASGPQAANVQGTHDQTDIFSILNGFKPSKIKD